jgi:hypothetical protein
MINRVILEMVRYFGNDVRRINHALKVYGFSCAISSGEVLSDTENTVLALSAILHDIGIREAERKYNSASGTYQELEGPPVAGAILEEAGVPDAITGRVCHLVGNHHSYLKIDGIDFQILVEADFLVNIYEDNMDKASIDNIASKLFSTETGFELLRRMYL